ncbi:MAG: hypothetical protein AB1403_14270 [Candidatus Riflebacteria bacterium]
MKKIGIGILFLLGIVVSADAEMIVSTTDGREFKLPVNAGDIADISFSTISGKPSTTQVEKPASQPEPAKANNFLGLWHRIESGKTVEYMEIRMSKGKIEAVFGTNPKGPFSNSYICSEQNGALIARGKRILTIRADGEDRLNYTSADVSGVNPWTCSWIRSR